MRFETILKTAAVAGTLLFAAVTTAQAGTACTAGIAAKVTGTSACELGNNSQDFLSDPLQVNKDAMFGHADWKYAGKDDGPNGSTSDAAPLFLKISSNGTDPLTQGGMWKIVDNAFSIYEHIMLVFKGPNENSGTYPGSYVGYLLSATSGDYSTMFAKLTCHGGGPNTVSLCKKTWQGISHITIYGRGTGDDPGNPGGEIPLPGSLPLLLGSVAGLGLIARRRRTS